MLVLAFALCCSLQLIASASTNNVVLDGRIVGGVETTIRQAPFLVSLQKYGEHWCGGSLISANFVLTAAHCFFDITDEVIIARVGSTSSKNGGQLVEVEKIICHDGFDLDVVSFDIAFLKLKTNVIFSPSVRSIKYTTSEPFPNRYVDIYGWGKESQHNMDLPENLRKARVMLLSRDMCRSKYDQDIDPIHDYNICAYTDGVDSCKSDSGGPLIADSKLAGIVSWGKGCAVKDRPGVYTSVAKFTNWIETMIKNNS